MNARDAAANVLDTLECELLLLRVKVQTAKDYVSANNMEKAATMFIGAENEAHQILDMCGVVTVNLEFAAQESRT